MIDVFDRAFREACSAFDCADVDITVCRDSSEDEHNQYVARAVHNRTLAMAHGETPAEALEQLIRRIIVLGTRGPQDTLVGSIKAQAAMDGVR